MGAPLPLCANGEAQAPFAIHTELARAVTPPFNEARTGGPAQGDMMWRIKGISPFAHTISCHERATSLPAESHLYSDCVTVPSQPRFQQGLCKPSEPQTGLAQSSDVTSAESEYAYVVPAIATLLFFFVPAFRLRGGTGNCDAMSTAHSSSFRT